MSKKIAAICSISLLLSGCTGDPTTSNGDVVAATSGTDQQVESAPSAPTTSELSLSTTQQLSADDEVTDAADHDDGTELEDAGEQSTWEDFLNQVDVPPSEPDLEKFCAASSFDPAADDDPQSPAEFKAALEQNQEVMRDKLRYAPPELVESLTRMAASDLWFYSTAEVYDFDATQIPGMLFTVSEELNPDFNSYVTFVIQNCDLGD